MLQREIVRFRASDTQPNPLEVDYWIDVTSNYYGGCIRYYRNDTNTWEMLNLNDKQVDAIIDYINNALNQIEQFINDSITEIRNELAEFKDELKEEVNKLWQYINQKVEELTTQISNIRDEIKVIGGNLSSIQQKITELTQNIQELDSKIDQQISDLRSYINSEIVKAKNELKTYVDGKVADLTELINQEIENRTNADNNLQSQINELKQLITKAQGDIDTHAARRDNPHVVTRAQLSLATTDNVVFNKVSAPSGFFKE